LKNNNFEKPPFFSCLIILLSCKSAKKSFWNTKKFIPLETSITPNFMDGYSLEIPSDWYSYIGYHEVFHSPKSIMESNVEDQKVTITVFIVENVESKINFFKNEIKTNNIFVNTNFEKKIIKTTKYGDALILKYGSIWDSISYTNLYLYYYHKNKIYKLHLKGSNEHYKEFLDQAITIMDSFKVKE
jgi:hypothetical protein